MTVSPRTLQTVPLREIERSIIDDLRSHVERRRALEAAKPTLGQVKRICADIRSGVPLAKTATRLKLGAGIDAERFVLDVVATFGTWLAHSVGSSGMEVEYAAHKEQQELIPSPVVSGSLVTAPLGYEPTAAHRRDVGKALAAIAALGDDTEVISRFVSRTYAQRPAQIDYPLIAGVWGFASRGRLAELKFVSDDLVFQGLAVDAYDLLDVARLDAEKALRQLVDIDDVESPAIASLVSASYWVDEPRMSSILRASELSGQSDVAKSRIARDLAALRMAYSARPSMVVPAAVGALSLGQVQRICASSGIKVRSENRLEETEIRASLKEMGLSIDADRLVPVALKCADNGDLDSFWDVMQLRVDGAPNWSDMLEELSQ